MGNAKPRPLEDARGRSHMVPMPAFTDPHLPEADGGSVNYGHDTFGDVEAHPLAHAPDYGNALNTPVAANRSTKFGPRPADRDEWKKDDWKSQAEEYGLTVSGNMDELIGRVEEHEKEEGIDNG